MFDGRLCDGWLGTDVFTFGQCWWVGSEFTTLTGYVEGIYWLCVALYALVLWCNGLVHMSRGEARQEDPAQVLTGI